MAAKANPQYAHSALGGQRLPWAHAPLSNEALKLLQVSATGMFIFFVVLITWTCISDGTPFNSDLLLAPWMTTTLYDFYGLVLFLWVYVLLVETSLLAGLGWCAAFACGGSAGMWAFAAVRLWRASPGDSLHSIFLTQQ